jgi:hypothetical protein
MCYHGDMRHLAVTTTVTKYYTVFVCQISVLRCKFYLTFLLSVLGEIRNKNTCTAILETLGVSFPEYLNLLMIFFTGFNKIHYILVFMLNMAHYRTI